MPVVSNNFTMLLLTCSIYLDISDGKGKAGLKHPAYSADSVH